MASDFFKNFIYLWLCWVFIAACWLSLVVLSGDYPLVASGNFSLVAVHGLFIVKYALYGIWVLIVAAFGFSCAMSCGIFQDQGSNLSPLHCKVNS